MIYEPRFRVGDKVQQTTRDNRHGVIVDGPFAPGVQRLGESGSFNTVSYAVAFETETRLVGEPALASEWEPVNDGYEYRVTPGPSSQIVQRRRRTP